MKNDVERFLDACAEVQLLTGRDSLHTVHVIDGKGWRVCDGKLTARMTPDPEVDSVCFGCREFPGRERHAQALGTSHCYGDDA